MLTTSRDFRQEASHADVSTTATQASSQPAKYSIERILALEEYSRTKSIWHVLTVIVAAPVLPLVSIIAFEMPPLQPIEAGWRANGVFFIARLGCGMMVACEAGMTILLHLVPSLTPLFSIRVRLAIAMLSATVYVLSTLLLAQVWGFPVPFTTSLANPTGGSVLLIATFVTATNTQASIVDLKRQLVHFCCLVLTVPAMTIVYPAYMALFLSVDRSYQPFVMLLVPVIKILFRKLITRIAAEWEDLVPIMVIFSIEMFNSLYQVVCVQSGGSIITTVAVMGIDLLHALRSQWNLHHSTAKLQKMLSIAQNDALLPLVCSLCEDAVTLRSSRFQSQELLQLRLHSALSRSGLSDIGRLRLESIEKIGIFTSGMPSVVAKGSQPQPATREVPKVLFLKTTKVAPLKSVVSSDPTDLRLNVKRVSRRKMSAKTAVSVEQSDAIVEAARMLFRSEYLLLGEYLECTIPWIYATNLVALWLSPNAAYYPHTRAITSSHDMEATLLHIGALFALEIGTFALLAVVLWKRLKFSPLHQLSFVLEHQGRLLRIMMLLFLVLSTQFNLDHEGADFSFQFKWLHKP